jgi:hypothetical protein
MIRVVISALALMVAAVAGLAQTAPATATADPAISATRVFGKVTEINGPGALMIIKTDAGSMVLVKVTEKTTYERMPPGETDTTKAVKITMADITAGDGVYARGYVSDDRKSVPAQKIVVVSQSDIAKKQEKERLEWRQRGILGAISAVNPATKEVTISFRSMMGAQPVIIPIGEKTKMLRYAPDSIRFADAKPSVITELKVGDQLRALGDRSADGTHFTAEKVVTGSFRTVGGVVIKNDAVLRRFPADIGMMMMGGGGARPGGGGAAPAGGPPSAAAGQGPGAGGGMRMGGGGGGMNIQAMLENLPTIAVADLKVGDTIIVSSTTGADPGRLTAITLVSGADTLLSLLAARQPQGGQPGGGAAAAGGGGGGGAGIGFFGGIGP